jgi:hypothetical protein
MSKSSHELSTKKFTLKGTLTFRCSTTNDTLNKNIGPKGKRKIPVGACQYVLSKHGSKNDFYLLFDLSPLNFVKAILQE